ncbi:MAG: helix-turn-helix domain-containing protein [Oscillospiraceae bacterium]|nr:helix-turn-helix domain-containing protein [Oscillospiraceae bacterium]
MYQRIRDLREDKDLYQKDLASLLKCTQVCYSNYETGKRDVPTEVLIKLAAFYQTSTDYILGLTDVATAYPRSKR